MPSGLQKTSGNHFQITFEPPWGGVASDTNALDIKDNQFASSNGILDIDGLLSFVSTIPAVKYFFWNPPGLAAGGLPFVIVAYQSTAYAFDQFGNVYLWGIFGIPGTYQWKYIISASDSPWAPTDSPDDGIVIDGKIYVSSYSRHSIYVFDPVAVTFTLASDYAGGKILATLDDYLLQLNTNSAVDGPKPTRVNWSAPGAFSTWDPAIDRTAGFNTLVNLDDSITGFVSLASVGIIIGEKGLVEASPTGIGIEPFSFTSLWTSEVGQGVLYPNTVSQYGQNTYAGSNNGIFKLSTGGFVDISGAARKAILGPLQTDFQGVPTLPSFIDTFAGAIFLFAFNSSYPQPHYVFCGTTPNTPGVTKSQLYIWMVNLATGAWYTQVYDLDTVINAYLGNISGPMGFQALQIKIVNIAPNVGTSPNKLPVILLYGIAQTDGSGTTKVAFMTTTYVYNAQDNDNDDYGAGPLLITTKAFEVQPGRQPTIRRILIKGFGVGVLLLTINGKHMGRVVLDGTTTLKTYLSSDGQYTGESPQLTVSCAAFKGCIEKIVMYGTYADGEID